MSPHHDIRVKMCELEVGCFRPEALAIPGVLKVDAEGGLVVVLYVVSAHRSKLGIGRHKRRGYIVREQGGVGVNMHHLHHVLVLDSSVFCIVRQFSRRDDLP